MTLVVLSLYNLQCYQHSTQILGRYWDNCLLRHGSGGLETTQANVDVLGMEKKSPKMANKSLKSFKHVRQSCSQYMKSKVQNVLSH